MPQVSEFLRPWKLFSLAVGVALLIAGAFYYEFPDWDVPISVIMAALAYLTAPWSMRVILERQWTLRKGRFWHYENEFRFTRYPNRDLSGFPIRFDGQHASFGPNELCGLTLGARMQADEVEEFRKLASMHVPNLPVWRARESRSDYSLEFESLDAAP